jgi:hypothetical protein
VEKVKDAPVFNDADHLTRVRVPRTNSRAQISRILQTCFAKHLRIISRSAGSIRIAAAFICDPVSWRPSDSAGRSIAARVALTCWLDGSSWEHATSLPICATGANSTIQQYRRLSLRRKRIGVAHYRLGAMPLRRDRKTLICSDRLVAARRNFQFWRRATRSKGKQSPHGSALASTRHYRLRWRALAVGRGTRPDALGEILFQGEGTKSQ